MLTATQQSATSSGDTSRSPDAAAARRVDVDVDDPMPGPAGGLPAGRDGRPRVNGTRVPRPEKILWTRVLPEAHLPPRADAAAPP